MLMLSAQGPGGRSVLSRRALLRASLLSAGGFALPRLLRARAEAAAAGRPRRDTAVIQLWLGGGPSHLDTYDLKPAAPAEIRGPFRPICTNVPGVHICELLPRQARMIDRLAIVRSMHHTTDEHPQGAHWMQTGYLAPVTAESMPTHPSAGSITALLRGANRRGMVPYVHIAPDPMGFPIFVRVHDAAYLGSRYAPFMVKSARARTDPQRTELADLISRVHFDVPNLELLPGLDVARLGERVQLRRLLDGLRRRVDANVATGAVDQDEQQALDLVSSDTARRAFDLSRESPHLRDRYGMNIWGQGLLLCRRLVEAGVTFVTLNTDSFSGQWDNHGNIKGQFEEMLPVYDRMLTAFLEDVAARGLAERVLLLVCGEFGRTPKMNSGGGRDHWGRAGFALLAGGGLRGGVVVGSTTSRGEEPKERPIWPGDILATVYRHLGIDPTLELPDRAGRPVKVLSAGEPIRELIG
jgi:hypothetical protein